MSYVIGIDTGGTYTDSVLLETVGTGSESVLKKAKAFTTHENLEIGIENSLNALQLTKHEINAVNKVVLSTTLATNAIVENKLCKTGLILIGERPNGKLATNEIEIVQGQVSIKGYVNINLNKKEVYDAIGRLYEKVEAIAVSGAASVKNPILEQEVKALVNERCDMPVICGHEFVNELGFIDRTNTVVINAGLVGIINRFISSIKCVLNKHDIKAPAFIVRGNGTLVSLDFIGTNPVETVLSGPAASLIGTVHLTNISNAVIADMGGTTTDIGIIKNKRVALSEGGAWIGGWNLKIKSAKLNTVGLGGDSQISIIEGKIKVGPKRILPLCRGGEEDVTPTDLLHYTNEYVQWKRNVVRKKIVQHMVSLGMDSDEGVKAFEKAVIEKLYRESVLPYELLKFPLCAIGAPAKTWFCKTQQEHNFNLIVPENYEVANAVGAAVAGIQEIVQVTIRKGEENRGFLLHGVDARYVFKTKMEAVNKGLEVSRQQAEQLILKQGLQIGDVEIECVDSYLKEDKIIHEKVLLDDLNERTFFNKKGCFIEMTIKTMVNGKIFE